MSPRAQAQNPRKEGNRFAATGVTSGDVTTKPYRGYNVLRRHVKRSEFNYAKTFNPVLSKGLAGAAARRRGDARKRPRG